MNNNDLIEAIILNDEQASLPATSAPLLKKAMDFDTRDKSVEEKTYIILYRLEEDDMDDIFSRCFSVCIGRTEAYNDIKNNLISGLNIDIHKSKVITETKQTESSTGDRKYYLIPYEECISIYTFLTSVSDYYSGDDFNIEEYNNTEIGKSDISSDKPMTLTADQQEYRKMIEASMKRDKFLSNLSQQEGEDI